MPHAEPEDPPLPDAAMLDTEISACKVERRPPAHPALEPVRLLVRAAHSREQVSVAGLAECMPGVPVGALRASLGIPSNEDDVQRLIALVMVAASTA